MNGEEIRILFDERGLVPAVVQDVATGQVLMVAWMNEEALRLTQETGQAHFWSRSRRQLWHKGATSGHVMQVRDIRVDCDADTLLLQVEPAGPACHTGNQSCFFRPVEEFVEPATRRDADGSNVLDTLFATILDRQANPRPGSYTAYLLEAGEDKILKKIGEEAMEVILAAKAQGDARVVSEVGDLFYHLLVLLAARGLTLADVQTELDRRRQ
jgi:phosphoribosyl-ATP pyrophosphohydrolase/phosphoribosyl-AMP cyclohydrolase